jgi:hypothetical protein
MSKAAALILRHTNLTKDLPFRRNLFYFDQFFVNKDLFFESCHIIQSAESPKGLTAANFKQNLSDFNYLHARNMVEFWRAEIPLPNIPEIQLRGRSVSQKRNSVRREDKCKVRLRPADEISNSLIREMLEFFKEDEEKRMIEAAKLAERNPDYYTREFAAKKTQEAAIQVFPLLMNNSFDFNLPGSLGKDDIVKFVLTRFPEPHTSVPVDEIWDFRNDKNVKAKYYALINWVNDLAKQEFTPEQLQDKFNQLYSEYTVLYDAYHMKCKMSNLGIVLKSFPSLVAFLGSLVKDPGSLFNSLVNFGKEKADLMKEEMTLPSREIAYIHAANYRFSK